MDGGAASNQSARALCHIYCADRRVDEELSDIGTWDGPRSTLTSVRPLR